MCWTEEVNGEMNWAGISLTESVTERRFRDLTLVLLRA
jgi:hypothetical protein